MCAIELLLKAIFIDRSYAENKHSFISAMCAIELLLKAIFIDRSYAENKHSFISAMCAIDVSSKKRKLSFMPKKLCFFDTLLRNRFCIAIYSLY